ncbi:MAG: hypothetical protein HYX69_06010 [Planctomycetia bacterium]|nr:hypothetical protein [Planctomycetia bacterium]
MYGREQATSSEIEQFMLMWIEAPEERSQTLIGPARSFRAAGVSLRQEPDGRQIATFRRGAWTHGGAKSDCRLLWTEMRTIVRFEDPATGDSISCGPFDMVGVVDGTMHVDREHSRPLARLDEDAGAWRMCEDETVWPVALLLPAPHIAFPVEHWMKRFGANGRAATGAPPADGGPAAPYNPDMAAGAGSG